MNRSKSIVFSIFIAIVLMSCSCAVSHKPISLNNIETIDNIRYSEEIIITYSDTNILLNSDNSRYAKKARRKNLQIIPICIQNNSSDTFFIENNHTDVFIDFEPVLILKKEDYYKKIKQHPVYYTIVIFIAIVYYFPPTNMGIQFFPQNPTGLFIPWGIWNIIKAKKANKLLFIDLEKFDLSNKKIPPGESLCGFICVKSEKSGNLLIRFK